MFFVSIFFLIFYFSISIAVINAIDPSPSPKLSSAKGVQQQEPPEGQSGGESRRRSERIKKRQERKESGISKARSRLVQSRAARQGSASKKDTEETASGVEETIRKPIVVPYTDPEPSSSTGAEHGHHVEPVNSTAQRATLYNDVGDNEMSMRQVCTCDSCTEAAVKSYKRLVNEGKVTDYRSFGEYWRTRCVCGVEEHAEKANDLLKFYDESPY